MNARDAYYRIIAGDYLGQRTIQGQSVPSIYRQYALAVERGVLEYFAKSNGLGFSANPPPRAIVPGRNPVRWA
jgi:hypothetical protein